MFRIRNRSVTACSVLMLALVLPELAGAQVLVHRYSFNDGTANDSIGTANGTLSGGATISGGAVLTNGSYNNGVKLPLAATAGIDGSFTIEDWFTRTNTGGDFTTPFTFGSPGKYLIPHPDDPRVGQFNMEYYDEPRLLGTALNNSVETMILTSYDAGTNTAAFYINGQLQASEVFTGNFDLGNVSSGGYNGIGGFDTYGDGSTPGSTDEFRIYTGALTARQIAADYANGPDVIPEPTSLSLMLLAGVPLLRRRRPPGGV